MLPCDSKCIWFCLPRASCLPARCPRRSGCLARFSPAPRGRPTSPGSHGRGECRDRLKVALQATPGSLHTDTVTYTVLHGHIHTCSHPCTQSRTYRLTCTLSGKAARTRTHICTLTHTHSDNHACTHFQVHAHISCSQGRLRGRTLTHVSPLPLGPAPPFLPPGPRAAGGLWADKPSCHPRYGRQGAVVCS